MNCMYHLITNDGSLSVGESLYFELEIFDCVTSQYIAKLNELSII